MARILDFFLHRKSGDDCKLYTDHEALLSGLLQESPGAIRCLSSKISAKVYQIGKMYQLSDEDIEEFQCDCILLFIKKLKGGKYVYQGHNPVSYVIEIAKMHVRFKNRQAQRAATQPFEPGYDRAEEEGVFPGSEVNSEILVSLLNKVGDNCQRLIRLYYLEELKDKEVIEQGLTQYSTVDALKNHRAKCMKKLLELASEMTASGQKH
jgi:hypothetical protein